MSKGRERIKQLVEALESWRWAHTEHRPSELERAIAAGLDGREDEREA